MAANSAVFNNATAELAVLGSCARDRNVINEISDFLTPEDFYDKRYGAIWQFMLHQNDNDLAIDSVTLEDFLQMNPQPGLEPVPFMKAIAKASKNPEHVTSYALIVKNNSIHRGASDAAAELSKLSMDKSPEFIEKLENFSRDLLVLSGERRGKGFSAVGDLVDETIREIVEAAEGITKNTAYPTGFHALDGFIGGVRAGGLYILAARPSMGKTALAMNIARNVAENGATLVYSLEMGKDQLMQRLISAESGVPLQDIVKGDAAREDGKWDAVNKAGEVIRKLPLFIDESSALTIAQISASAQRFKQRHGNIAMVVIDYLQLIGAATKSDSRQNEVAEISRGLKSLARQLDAPVLALSQLSRAVESRNDKQPQLSDLRDSGAIEQDADVVLMLYREGYYKKEEEANDNSALLSISKNRNGPTGQTSLVFNRECVRFLSSDFGY